MTILRKTVDWLKGQLDFIKEFPAKKDRLLRSK